MSSIGIGKPVRGEVWEEWSLRREQKGVGEK